MSAIGRLPSQGKTSLSNRRKMRSPWLLAQPGENFACHSRAMASKLSAPAMATFSALRASAGSTLAASCWRAAIPASTIKSPLLAAGCGTSSVATGSDGARSKAPMRTTSRTGLRARARSYCIFVGRFADASRRMTWSACSSATELPPDRERKTRCRNSGAHRKGQFRAGNRAAVGNGGGGRPPSELRAITTRDASRVWRELRRVAFDVRHPLHDRHAFEALRELARLIFPRPQAVAFEDPESGEGRSLKDCIRIIVGGNGDAG